METIEVLTHRGCEIIIEQDYDTPCPIDRTGVYEGLGCFKYDGINITADPLDLFSRYPRNPELFYTTNYTAYHVYGHPRYEVIVDRSAVADGNYERFARLGMFEYTSWATGHVFRLTVKYPDGSEDSVGGVYYDDGAPDEEETIELLEELGFFDGVEDMMVSRERVADTLVYAGIHPDTINRVMGIL